MEDRIRNSALKIFLLIIEHPEIIGELKKNVIKTDYSNVEEMTKVEQLIEEGK